MPASAETTSGDVRPISDGSTLLFATLVVLILATSGLMLVYVAMWWVSKANAYVCGLAAGLDPTHPSDLKVLVGTSSQGIAYSRCASRFAQPPPWWVPASWVVLLCGAAVVLFFCLPVWKARRSKVVPLAAVDHDGEIQRALEQVASVAGVVRMPRVVVDPTAASVGALVFGRTKRPVLSLHGGLLARRASDPDGFRAILLHEFAHVRNGDITLTYATVALWRVFLVLAAPPYLLGLGVILFNGMRSGSQFLAAPSRSVLQMVFLAVLVYLARSDVLRNREIHADRAAARWGADPRGWHHSAPVGGGMLVRKLAGFVDLWRTHPRWDLRRDALTDAGPVYSVSALPMFLLGAGAALINMQLVTALSPYAQYSASMLMGQVVAFVAAGMIAGVAGTAVWRAVIHATLTGRRPPSGLHAGVWLGIGLVAGALISGQGTINQALPSRIALLVQFPLGGAAFTWWIAQCARLWVTTWRGRSLRPALVMSLVAGGIALSQWFSWWYGYGVRLAAGWWYDPAGFRQWLEQTYPGSVGEHQTMLSGIAVVSAILFMVMDWIPFVGVAVAALWVMPLAAWIAHPRAGVRPWTQDARDVDGAVEPPAQGLPRLRHMMLLSVLCGVGCWAVFAAALLFPQTGVSGASPQRTSLPGLLFLGWTYVALTTMAFVAVVVTALRARRYRLLLTLAAAQITALVGLTGLALLLSFDGCIDQLSLFESSCAWRPGRIVRWADLHLVLDFAAVTNTIVAVAVAAAVSAIRRAPVFRRRHDAGPTLPRGHRTRAGRALLAALCIVALTISGTVAFQQQRRVMLS